MLQGARSPDTVQGIRVWHVPGFEGLCFYRGNAVTHSYPRHWHDELHLCAYVAGSGYASYRGCSYRFSAGDFVVTPAGEVHSNWVDKDSAIGFRSVYIDIPVLRDYARQVTCGEHSAPDFPSILVDDKTVKRDFLHVHHAMELPLSRLHRDELLLRFFHSLITRCAEPRGHNLERKPGSERAAVRRTRHFIDEHFAEPISLARLAALADLSPYHLHNLFRRETGMPPHAYQTQVRINRAKELLRQGLPLAGIALDTGFADQSHFARHFRRLVGVTPGRFAVAP